MTITQCYMTITQGCNDHYPIPKGINDHYPMLYVITLALKWLLGLVFLMTMASISSNDYSDSGALPSSSTSGSSDHPPNPKRQHRDLKSTDHQRSFKEEWRKQCFVIPHPTTSGQCICLVCLTVFNQFKVYTIKRDTLSPNIKFNGSGARWCS